MIKQDKGLQRDTIDKYYTKINVVEECKMEILKYIAIHENDLIIEPSAGNGSFIKMIKELTMNHKFYDLIPENKEIMGEFAECLEGIKEACEYLNYPVVSGNVSFYNGTNKKNIFPTPVIGGVGLIKKLSKPLNHIFKKEKDILILIGKTFGHIEQSCFLKSLSII